MLWMDTEKYSSHYTQIFKKKFLDSSSGSDKRFIATSLKRTVELDLFFK